MSLLLLALCLATPVYSQDSNQHMTMEIENGRVVSWTSESIPPAKMMEEFDVEPKFDMLEASPTPPDKIYPSLKEMLKLGDKDERVRVIVNFRDSLKIPRFPDLVPRQRRTSPANRSVLLRTAGMIRNIESQREANNRKRMKAMRRRYQLEFHHGFWLTDAMVVSMPLGLVQDLAKHPDVLYIMPEVTGDPPPIGDGNASNDVIDGRERMLSDAYFNLGLTSEYIGLLDTGIRYSHVQFNNPQRYGYLLDCVGGITYDCSGGNPNDDYWNHGTGAAAILSANSNQGEDYRGVTAMTVDSIKVYSSIGLDVNAAIRGIEQAMGGLGDKVIVANVQAGGTPSSSPLSTTADSAFDAGVVVIAANGNTNVQANVTSPGNAHKVIGVGAVDVVSLTTWPTQTVGPADDGRIKPDLQAPTNVETASSASDTALRNGFDATSGATPFAGGVAALFRAWLRSGNGGASVDPGQVYAYMILSGQTPAFNNTTGVGLIVMPTSGTTYSGNVTLTATGQVFDIPLNVTGGTRLDAALWWPETASQAHNDIDLRLYDPSGVLRAYSRSGPSIFERARYDGTITAGTWTLKITGFAVPSSPQTVYYAAYRK
jgi:hypothetical protein